MAMLPKPHLVGMCGSSTSSRTWNRHSYGGYIEVVVMPGNIWIFYVSFNFPKYWYPKWP